MGDDESLLVGSMNLSASILSIFDFQTCEVVGQHGTDSNVSTTSLPQSVQAGAWRRLLVEGVRSILSETLPSC